MSRKEHFWKGMGKVEVCGYFAASAICGLGVFVWAVIIFTMWGWVPK